MLIKRLYSNNYRIYNSIISKPYIISYRTEDCKVCDMLDFKYHYHKTPRIYLKTVTWSYSLFLLKLKLC